MEKLRDAICGKSGKNLDDLTHMTGKHFQHSYYFIVPIGIYISVIETKQQPSRISIIGFEIMNLTILFEEFCHTGDIESLNSLQLKYANKTDHFGWLGMLIRSCLAAIDFNESADHRRHLLRGKNCSERRLTGRAIIELWYLSEQKKMRAGRFLLWRSVWKA